jgi:hypothetical protein
LAGNRQLYKQCTKHAQNGYAIQDPLDRQLDHYVKWMLLQ